MKKQTTNKSNNDNNIVMQVPDLSTQRQAVTAIERLKKEGSSESKAVAQAFADLNLINPSNKNK